MIEIEKVSKKFGDLQALNEVTFSINDGEVFGLLGTNGSGKSTFMRIMAGILKQDSGTLIVDNQGVYENIEIKKDIFLIPDELYFFAAATPKDMGAFYSMAYPQFDMERYKKLLEQFELGYKRKINTLSKGLRKQLSIIIGICAKTKYLFCDETFDGLDPIMRKVVKSIFAAEMTEREFIPIITSHNVRELEDICDSLVLLHKGSVLFAGYIDEMKNKVHRIQCIFPEEVNKKKFLEDINASSVKNQGSMLVFTVRGNKEDILGIVKKQNPLFVETIPLSLEEIIISEGEVAGYEVQKFIE